MSISAVGGYGSYQTQQSYSVRGGGGGDFATRFAAMDANGDGSLDVSESGLSADTFTKTDSNGDGLLTYSDFTSRMQSMAGQGRGPGGPGGAPPPAEEMISQLDSDGDGELSAEEFAIDSEMFSAIDSDGSGGLSQAELEAHQSSMEAQRAARGEEGQAGMAPPPPPSADDLMASLDSDGDGELSSEEFAIDSEMFSAIDSDGSGGLSQAELEAHRGSMEAQRQAAQNRNSQSYQHQYGLSAYQAQSGVSPWMLSSYGAGSGISQTA